ncbi:MAG: phenylalanine--tRNA ligase subunit alpha, partial [Thermoanaerobaculia bacterium]
MLDELKRAETGALEELAAVADEGELAAWRSRHLGKKSPIKSLLAGLGALDASERPAAGREANLAQRRLQEAFGERQAALERAALEASLGAEALDVTLPGRPPGRGRLHVSSLTLRRIAAVWAEMGFQIYRSREVETDEYNFQLLNFPPFHPAREMQDTFFTT